MEACARHAQGCLKCVELHQGYSDSLFPQVNATVRPYWQYLTRRCEAGLDRNKRSAVVAAGIATTDSCAASTSAPMRGVETAPVMIPPTVRVREPRDAGSGVLAGAADSTEACDQPDQWNVGVGQCGGMDPFAGADELLDRLGDVPDVDVHCGHHALVV